MPKSSNGKKGAGSPALHPFDPIVFDDSEILILGSFPSFKSFENSFYYSHPRNQFWPLLGEIFQKPFQTQEERMVLLKEEKIALWDVVASCYRTNSSDANLRVCRPNDIEGLLRSYPAIHTICFTGQKAQQLFEHFFGSLGLIKYRLPSPSPAYASMHFEKKLAHWRHILAR